MKRLTTLLVIGFIVLSCNTRKINKTDLQKDNLKGNILGVTQVEYKAVEKFGEPVKDELVKDFVNPNSVKTYNSQGNLFEDWWLLGVEKLASFKYYYDESGKLDFIDYFNSNDELSTKSKYAYDPDGKIKNETRYDGEGNFAFTMEYAYNNKNQLTKKTPVYPLKNQERYNDTITYEYFGDSLKIVRYNNSPNKKDCYEKYKFDKKISSDPGNDFREFTYNEFGDIASEKMGYTGSKLILVYKYKYDSGGNWIELVKYGKPDLPNYDKLHPLRIVFRSIIYRTSGPDPTAKEILAESTYLKEFQAAEKMRIQEQYCNELTIKDKIVNGFKEKLPNWNVLLETISFMPLNDCKYRVNFVIQNTNFSDIRKAIELVFSYSDDYKSFSFSEWKESSL